MLSAVAAPLFQYLQTTGELTAMGDAISVPRPILLFLSNGAIGSIDGWNESKGLIGHYLLQRPPAT